MGWTILDNLDLVGLELSLLGIAIAPEWSLGTPLSGMSGSTAGMISASL